MSSEYNSIMFLTLDFHLMHHLHYSNDSQLCLLVSVFPGNIISLTFVACDGFSSREFKGTSRNDMMASLKNIEI